MYKPLPLVAKALLDAIAGPESSGRYDIIVGGSPFSTFVDHPRLTRHFVKGPLAGVKSDAAGRYQFLASTWDGLAKKLALKDFSPDNQDMAAWDYAKSRYAGYSDNHGLSLQAALESNDPTILDGVVAALRGAWTSMPGGSQQGQGNTQSQFQSSFDTNAAKWAGQAGNEDPYAANKSPTSSGLPGAINQATGGAFPYEGILPAPSTGDVTLPFLQDPPLNGGSASLDVLRLDPGLAIPPRQQFDAVYDPWTGTMVPTDPTTNGVATSIDDSGWAPPGAPRASATVPSPISSPLGAINAFAPSAIGAGPASALGYANGGPAQGWNPGFAPATQPSPPVAGFYNNPSAGLPYANSAIGPNYGAPASSHVRNYLPGADLSGIGWGGPQAVSTGPGNPAPLSDFERQMAQVPSMVIPKYIPVTHHVPNPAYAAQFGPVEPPVPDFMGMLAARLSPDRGTSVDPAFAGQAPGPLGTSPPPPMSDYLLDKIPPPLPSFTSPPLPTIQDPEAIRAILVPALQAVARQRALAAQGRGARLEDPNGVGGSLSSTG